MNILMVNYEYPPVGGGGGIFNKQLAEELSKNNNITVITSKFGDQRPHEFISNVEIIRVPVFIRNNQNAATITSMLSFFPSSLWTGYNLTKNRMFDIVHSMFAIPSAPSGLALSKKLHVPHLLSILGGDIYDPSKNLSPHKTPLLHYTVKKMINKSDKVIALSSDIKKRATEYYDISRKIDIIHLGIPKPIFKKKTRDKFGFNPDDILLVTVGRLVARKANQDLIRIVKSIENPCVKLAIIGDGPERNRLEELSNSLRVSERIFFLGRVSDEEKFQVLSFSDCYVSSSHHEGFGIVFLEAMALGLPIVCYDNGGQADFLYDGKTGFLVNCENVELFAKKVEEICLDSALRIKIGRFNIHHIESFCIESCANRYQYVYNSLVNKKACGKDNLSDAAILNHDFADSKSLHQQDGGY